MVDEIIVCTLSDGRPSWDEYYLLGTQWAALRGDCTRSKVGALLVDRRSHRIIAHGYNGTSPGVPGCLLGNCPRGLLTFQECPPDSDYSNCIAQHAEWNCLNYAIDHEPWYDFKDTIMYVSRKPCHLCLPYLQAEGVSRVTWPSGSLDLTLPKM